MTVIMGGSGSTGSSLVKNILNRHKDIFAGEETSFFAKKLIYNDWEKAKKRVTKRKLKGLKNLGYHIYNGTDMVHAEYGHTKDEIKRMAKEARTLNEFCDRFYRKALDQNEAKIWIEKTPANSACFSQFLEHFESGKVIHMLRNPYDTIASLWSRGYDLHYAVGIYLLNTASGISSRNKDRYHEIRYEDVVSEPESTINDVCMFLEVEYAVDMLTTKQEKIEVSQLPGWNYDETSNIGTKALGRFGRLPKEKRNQLIEAVSLIEVSKSGKELYNIMYSNIRELCQVLGYEYHEADDGIKYLNLKKVLKKDRLQRIKRTYATGIHYPLVISDKA